jgi:hypothetical protein
VHPIASVHPTDADLVGYAFGKLDAAGAARIQAHLAGCTACRAIVERTLIDNRSRRTEPPRPASQADTPSTQSWVTHSDLPALADVPQALRDHSRYRILRPLGRGGMGVVYQAEHRVMERLVAVKVISRALVDHPEMLERFHREVRAAAKLNHPNIVKAYDAEQAGDLQLLAMEYIEGRSLADVLAKKGPLPIANACHYVRQAALGLQHAFEQGMVHRDLKPQNLMLTLKGEIKILDFGLAKLASEQARPGGDLTRDNVVMGTPEYMAPEQAVNTKAADIRADIYALGCTLFCLLTGRPPFVGDSSLAIIVAQAQDAPPQVESLRPDVPGPLAALVGRMLAKDPAARPQTPKEVAVALAPFSKPANPAIPVVAIESSSATRVPARIRWHVPAAAAVLLVAGIGIWASGIFREKSGANAGALEKLPPDGSSAGGSIEGRLTNGLAPEQSEWAGAGFRDRGGTREPFAAAITITERRGQTFKARARAGSVKFAIEGQISESGEMRHKVTDVVEGNTARLENVTGGGEVGKNRMTFTFNNPDTGGTAKFELKRLADAGARFQFLGRWKCMHQPTGWTGFRTVKDGTTIFDASGRNDGTWTRDGGLIIVSFASGGYEYLAIDPDNPNELTGGNTKVTVTWIRQ